ncbi:MAG: zinc-dependent alcohol dehydrogenase [Pseudomonadota bacterium]
MKAAVVEKLNEPLVYKDVPAPKIDEDEILVKVHACGVCNGDIDAHSGIFPEFASPSPPRIPGHRSAGEVVEIGSAVSRIKLGDKVGVPLIHTSCGRCQYCFDGLHMLCAEVQLTGFQADGGYAEYVKAKEQFVGLIPEGLDMDQASHLTCTGVTAWGALKAAEVNTGDWCAIYGLGAVGEYTLQFAKSFGLNVVAISGFDEALEIAERNGADLVVNSRSRNVAEAIQEQIGGVHAIIVNSVKVEPFQLAFGALRSKGTLVGIGLPMEHLPIPIFEMIVREITVRGSFVGSRNDLERSYATALRDNIRIDIEEAPLAEVNDVYRQIKEGTTTARILLRP